MAVRGGTDMDSPRSDVKCNRGITSVPGHCLMRLSILLDQQACLLTES